MEPPQLSAHDATRRVPVTVVTGALGAGKSTLLQYILTAMHGRRIAVIENEFAERGGIEALVLKNGVGGRVADGFYELANGCICCSVRDGLVRALETLMRVRDRFDYILVETSGLADPGPVACVFWTDIDEDASLMLDAVVTVVDTVHVQQQLRRPRPAGAVNEVARQIALADVVLLNKSDVATKEQMAGAARAVAQLCPTARVATCHHGEVDLSLLLDVGAYRPDVPPHTLVSEIAAAATHAHEGESEAACEACAASTEHTHVHDASVETFTLRADAALSRVCVRSWLSELLWEGRTEAGDADDVPMLEDDAVPETQPAESPALPLQHSAKQAVSVLRMKGVLWLVDEDAPLDDAGNPASRPYILQAVQEQFDLQPVRPDLVDTVQSTFGARGASIIVIGQGLDESVLRAQLLACAA